MIATPLAPSLHCPLCHLDSLRQVARLADEAVVSRCRQCGLACGEHRSGAANADHFRGLDQDRYLRSVGATRLKSYDRLRREVQPLVSCGLWLDVGCSYGWLLTYMQERGYEALGLEPSPPAAAEARNRGVKVVEGLFPQDLPPDTAPRVISFMDVLEHLPDPIAALTAAREQLAPGGAVVVQVPDQACLLYQVAEGLCRLTAGRSSFALKRLWLVGFDFPHRYYFTQQTLQVAMKAAGLDVQRVYRTPIGNPRDALDRVAYTETGRVSLGARCVALTVAGINAADAISGYGGLLTMIATPAGQGNAL
jgi:SAM-dependent methyltransferase